MRTPKKAQEVRWLPCIFILITFAILTLNLAFYTHFQYFLHGDQGLPTASVKLAYLSFFTWQPENYSGYASIPTSIIGELFDLIQAVTYMFGSNLGYILSMSLFLLIGLIGVFYLVYDLTEVYTRQIRYIGSVAASIVFSFALPSLNFIVLGAVFLPWVFLFWKRLFYSNETRPVNEKVNFSGSSAINLIIVKFQQRLHSSELNGPFTTCDNNNYTWL